MFNEVNKIYFEILNYEKRYGQKDMAREYMYYDIHDTLDMLLQNKYIVVVKEMDEDLVVIEYNFNNDYIKSDAVNPYWLTEKEYNRIHLQKERLQEFFKKLP